MSVACIIQARMGSTRLPGKVLADVGGRPMLSLQIARLAPAGLDPLIVATTTRVEDNDVETVARESGATVVKGPEEDVLARFVTAIRAHPAEVVVRINGDCPFVDPGIVKALIELRAIDKADYASNSLIRTFPMGLDVEVVTAHALHEAAARAQDRDEREHVTPFVYRRPERYRLVAFRSADLLGEEQWNVDTPADLERIRSIAGSLSDPTRAGWQEILEVAGRHAVPQSDQVWLRPAIAGDDLVLDQLDEDPTFTSFGLAAARESVDTHLTDPSVRTWLGEVDGIPVGWAQLTVREGIGRLRGRIRESRHQELLRRVGSCLTKDKQIRELDPRSPPLP